MASKSLGLDHSEPVSVSSSESADDVLQVLEDQGFFYLANREIGGIVDFFYERNLFRDHGGQFLVEFKFFEKAFRKDSVSTTRMLFTWRLTIAASQHDPRPLLRYD